MTEQQVPAESYVGPAVVSASSTTPDPSSTTAGAVTVEVTLRGHFEPLDGRFHWYGRIAAHEGHRWRSGATVVVATPRGSAAGRLSDLDPWGRFRVSGTGRPPF